MTQDAEVQVYKLVFKCRKCGAEQTFARARRRTILRADFKSMDVTKTEKRTYKCINCKKENDVTLTEPEWASVDEEANLEDEERTDR